MKKFSEELRSMLTDFIVNEIGSKGIDGITYTMKLNNKNNSKDIEKYINIRKEADKCGYDSDEVFRVTELSNGYIFDVDIKTMTQILVTIAKAASNITGKHSDMINEVYTEPVEVRKNQIVRMSKLVENDKSEDNKIIIGLYNRNTSSKANYLCKENNKSMTLDVFRMRHNDIKAVNEGVLIEKGYLIDSVSIECILPSERAVLAKIGYRRV